MLYEEKRGCVGNAADKPFLKKGVPYDLPKNF